MIIIISLLVFFPIIFLISLTILLRTRESIKHEINWRTRCWYCKDKIEPFQQKQNSDNKLKCCSICERHIKIVNIESRYKTLLIKFHKFIVSEKFTTFTFRFVIFNLILLVFYLLWIFFVKKYVLVAVCIFFLFNTLFWIFLLLNQLLTSIKKEKPSK